MLAGVVYGGFVIVVDEDIDPSDSYDVLWAMATRTDPEKDIDVVWQAWGSKVDPLIHKSSHFTPTLVLSSMPAVLTSGRMISQPSRPRVPSWRPSSWRSTARKNISKG